MALDSQSGRSFRQYLSVSRSRIRSLDWGQRWSYINRKLPDAIAEAVIASEIRCDARVLDFGCADQPYRALFGNAAYLGADLPGNEQAEVIIAPDGRLPLGDSSIDFVLSSQVLEHVERPENYLSECWRVLRPGGRVVLSTHGLMVYHRDPVDYWRWTGDGLKKVVGDAGFHVDSLDGVMGLAPTGIQLFQDATLAGLPRVLWRPYCVLTQSLISLFDRFHSPESKRLNALVFIVCATKLGG